MLNLIKSPRIAHRILVPLSIITCSIFWACYLFFSGRDQLSIVLLGISSIVLLVLMLTSLPHASSIKTNQHGLTLHAGSEHTTYPWSEIIDAYTSQPDDNTFTDKRQVVVLVMKSSANSDAPGQYSEIVLDTELFGSSPLELLVIIKDHLLKYNVRKGYYPQLASSSCLNSQQ